MMNFKRWLSVLLVCAMVLSMSAALAGCKEETPNNTTTTNGSADVNKGTYSVSVQSVAGMALEGLDVYIYADDTLGDLVDYGRTDANGKVSFTLPRKDGYAITLSGAPKGYEVKSSYGFNGGGALIKLESALIQGESLSGATLGLGDVMYDFSIITPGGEKVTLSEMLKEKDMVLLNFWFSTCGPCANEFPYMEEAYQMYQENVGIIAMSPDAYDTNSSVSAYQQSMGLSFPMAVCPSGWTAAFGITGYPTSVVVDRYGVICLIEEGGLPSLRPFTSMFSHFTADDYTQKLCPNGVEDLVEAVKPNYTMDTSENIGALINSGDIQVTYRPETDEKDAEYAWPFIQTEKNGEVCLKASNQQIESSYAILYADVTLKAGQAIGFEYLASSERSADVMHVIVNDEAIYQISGVSADEAWKACYPWVAEEDGVYEVALCYIKDESDNEGDDTVYIKNFHVADAKDIDVETFIPRYAATTEDGFDFSYVDIVYNEADGYYHVGSANGPLLLADLMNYTLFNEEQTIWDIAYDGAAAELYPAMEPFFTLASNSSLAGVCTVTYELAELLKEVAKVAGFDAEDENEWLKICKYFQVYGSGDAQLEDPIKGLAPFSAYQATLGKNVETNFFYYGRIIMPRGLFAEFVPTKSGVYRITSRSESEQGVDGWIFNENRETLLTYELDERMYNDNSEVSMVYYMEAGKSYYIDIAFWDPYEIGYIFYDIEYLAPSIEHFRLASPGYFTYDTNATGDAMYHLIAGGIKPILGTDGYYHEDLGLDANGNQKYGSILYADFTGITSLFDTPISSVPAYGMDGKPQVDANGNPVMVLGMIEKGGFDFSKTADDLYILAFMNQNGGDVEKTDAYLREMWGEEYDGYAEIYQVEDVYAGRYHGTGEDYTEEMKGYLSKIATAPVERQGCVAVDARLAEILQMLMDKYTFENVDHSWVKLCYYYDYLGPEA